VTRIRQHFTFVAVFIAYAKFHRLAYAAHIARGVAYRNLPF
jgi:hypothetical protein